MNPTQNLNKMTRILSLFTTALLIATTVSSQSNKIKTAPKIDKKSAPAKTAKAAIHISEEEARRLHENNLAKEGKTNVRRAYKRNEFETSQHNAESAATAKPVHQNTSVTDQQTKNNTITAVNKPIASVAKSKEPKFIEGW